MQQENWRNTVRFVLVNRAENDERLQGHSHVNFLKNSATKARF